MYFKVKFSTANFNSNTGQKLIYHGTPVLLSGQHCFYAKVKFILYLWSGTIRRSGGVVSAIGKQLKAVNLKAVRRITVKFDPFCNKVTHTRNFLHYISGPKISLTNPNFTLKTEVVCDRSEPTIDITLLPAFAETVKIQKVTLKSGNLTCLEILQLLNKHISSLAPVDQVPPTTQTKLEKKKSKK